ncbi:magnesium and cobalt transport protein CorA [Agreia sp. VKM Ac-1783]|uniref:magnesium and cobalt transport protein CorA n=1 Tax=Agreia sp. VKM Ac-1783 TaxID=1938889 RepID=UPI0020166138|nr:magnesium and cobalt transport protein CorA [Agreia sp. VKM Ac-1783]
MSQALRAMSSLRPGSHPHTPSVAKVDTVPSPRHSSTVDNAVYADGRRVLSPTSLEDTLSGCARFTDSMAWIGLYRPNEAELAAIQKEFDLHPLAVEDAIGAHQRPKLERYGDTLFVVLRAASYSDEREEVDFGELHLFVGPNFVVSVRHSESPDLAVVRQRMEAEPELLALGPVAVLYGILDAVVDQYLPVVSGLENDIDEIEAQVFAGDAEVSRRIYELSQEVLDFQRATLPLVGMLETLRAGFDAFETNLELRRALRDVADHTAVVNDRVEGFRGTLREILAVNATLVAQRQNEDMKVLAEASNRQNEEVKKISAWAAIFFAPTVIAGIYGMNFDAMPELHWQYGYPVAIGVMLVAMTGLYVMFRRRGWL